MTRLFDLQVGSNSSTAWLRGVDWSPPLEGGTFTLCVLLAPSANTDMATQVRVYTSPFVSFVPPLCSSILLCVSTVARFLPTLNACAMCMLTRMSPSMDYRLWIAVPLPTVAEQSCQRLPLAHCR